MTSNEELIMLKAFLDLIKPSYSTYLMAGNILFEDSAAARDVGFCGTETWFMPFDHANRFISHDDWHYPELDSGERTFDSGPAVGCLQLTNIFPEYTLYDAVHPVVSFDDLADRTLDDMRTLDSDGVETLELTHE